MSVRTLPSILIKRCMTILVASELVKAYFSLLRRKITRGRHSLSLWGPVDGRGAKTPPNLSNIHAFGACKRLRCFLGPRACQIIFFKIIVMNSCKLHLMIFGFFKDHLKTDSKKYMICCLFQFEVRDE